MKKTIKKEIHICEECNREITPACQSNCKICGKELCYTCQKYLYDVHNVEICPTCRKRKDVQKLIEHYLEIWRRNKKRFVNKLKEV